MSGRDEGIRDQGAGIRKGSRTPVAAADVPIPGALFPLAECPTGALPAAPPASLARLLVPGEVIVLVTRPGLWFIVLRNLEGLLVVGALWAIAAWADSRGWVSLNMTALSGWFSIVIAANLIWLAVDRACRVYVLTDRRVLKASGVFRRLTVEVPLTSVVSIAMHATLRERVLGMGSIAFTTASRSSTSAEVWWLTLDRPRHALALALEAWERRHRGTGGGGV